MSERANSNRPQPIRKGTGYPVSLDRKPPTSGPVKGRALGYPVSIDGKPPVSSIKPTSNPPKSTPKSTK